MAVKILLDPGHFYGVNKVTSGYAEGTRMWVLYTMLRPMLEEYGFKVGTTRTSTYDYPKTSKGEDDITGRGKMANGYDIMLSLHTNAAGSTAVNRPVIIYPVSGKLKDLADDLGAALQECMNLQKYQLMQRWNSAGNADYYGVIRGAASVGVPCLILEHTFHTNLAMAKWLMSDANLKKVAQCVADTVAAYYGYKKTTTKSGWKKDDQGWWYQDADGGYPRECWRQIEGQWHCFDQDGYMLADTEFTYAGKIYVIDENGHVVNIRDKEEDSMSKHYTDVKDGAWYAEAVDYCKEQGLMQGVGDGKFEPEKTVSRAELAQALMNLHKKLRE